MPILVIFVLLIGPAFLNFNGATISQTPAKADSAEEAVLKVTREWLDAEERHDRATLQRIIADDFQGTTARGNTLSKGDVIPHSDTEGRGLAITTSNMKARIFGDTAVVTAHGVQKAGEKRELRFTVVFIKRDNQWQMVAGHLSAVPRE